MDTAGVFERHKRGNVIYLGDGDARRRERVGRLRREVLAALGGGAAGEKRAYQMHMTVAQSEDAGSAAHKFLVEKVGLVPGVEWEVGELCV